MDVSEKNFEASIEAMLLRGKPDDSVDAAGTLREDPFSDEGFPPGGYRRREPTEYDRDLCLIPTDALGFVYATQPKEWSLSNNAKPSRLPLLAWRPACA